MSIDVVIPTCNNLESKNISLFYTIKSILSQSVQPRKINIVENVDFEPTKVYLDEEFGGLVNVIDGTTKPNNISYARNTGAKNGNSKLLIFIDDDVVISRNYHFEKMLSIMKQFDFCCGAARYWTRADWNSYLNKSFHISHIQNILSYKTYLPKSIERVTGNPSFQEYSFIGHFGAIKREIFEKVKGFDENYKEWSYQDTDLMMRLCVEGFQYSILSNEDISVFHLSHGVDKNAFLEYNKKLFLNKQRELGVNFHLNHFFGIFDDDKYSILS